MVDNDTIFLYSRDNCQWCDKAKELLTSNGLEFVELKLGVDYTKEFLQNKTGINKRLTVPQIFVGDDHIGGYDHLKAWFSMNDQMKGNTYVGAR